MRRTEVRRFLVRESPDRWIVVSKPGLTGITKHQRKEDATVPLTQLTLESLTKLDDGRVPVAFQRQMQRAITDCMDRPNDKKPRTVTLDVEITPVTTVDGGVIECENVEIEFKIASKVPTLKSKTYSCRVNKNGQAAFSTESPENVNQLTFGDVDKSGKVNRQEGE